MKCIFCLNLILILLAAFVPYASAELDDTFNYGTGLIWDSQDVIEGHLIGEYPSESVLPAMVDLTDMFPTPKNQGSQNSCVAWAVAYALKSHQEQVSRDWGLDTDEHLFSPSYVYNQLNGGTNRGISPGYAMNLLVEQGVCTLASFPYDASDYLTQPTAVQSAEARYFKIRNWYSVREIDNIKRQLAKGDGVIIGLEIFPDFRTLSPSNPIYDTVSGSASGGHCVCLIGYDDEKSAFKFINSWGTSWGIGGYGWISYDMVENIEVNAYGVATGFVMEPVTERFYEDGFTYTINNGKAQIIGCVSSDKSVTIPNTLGGYPVSEIGYAAFDNCRFLTEVIIPDGVTFIGDHAFVSCKYLTRIFIPDSVEYISYMAFPSKVGYIYPLPELTIYCGENSYACEYAASCSTPFKTIKSAPKIIEPIVLANNDVTVNHLTLISRADGLYDIAAVYEGFMNFFALAVYENNVMTKVFIADDNAEIKNLTESNLKNGKFFFWNRNMQPCIEAVTYKKY